MITSETEGNSPGAALEPPTTAIDGAAESASAAQVAASASERFAKEAWGLQRSAGAETCGQPAEGRERPGGERVEVVRVQPVVGERAEAPGDHRACAARRDALDACAPGHADPARGRRGSRAPRRAARSRKSDHRDDREPLRRPPQERVVVVLDVARTSLAERRCCSSRGAAGSETSNSESCVPGRHALRRRVLADPEQLVLADRVQVGGVAEDLQLADHARARRVGEVERVERVGLAERDDEAAVADEAHGVDALAAAEPADLPDLHEPARAASRARSRSSRCRSPDDVVVAARSMPLCSDSDNWLSR